MRIFLSYCIVLLYSFTPLNAQKPKGIIYQYIDSYALRAINTMHDTGIPASLIMAIALEESAAGTSEVAKKAKNHFGMKAGRSWKSEVYVTKRGGKFRKYASEKESYEDFANLIKNNYPSLFKNDKSDYKGWAYALEKTNYCRSKGYAKRLINIIENHLLFNFDNCILEFK